MPAAGAKVVLVMGHTACGAIKGAIDNAELGNLTGLLAKIQPAVAATAYGGERTRQELRLRRPRGQDQRRDDDRGDPEAQPGARRARIQGQRSGSSARCTSSTPGRSTSTCSTTGVSGQPAPGRRDQANAAEPALPGRWRCPLRGRAKRVGVFTSARAEHHLPRQRRLDRRRAPAARPGRRPRAAPGRAVPR